MTMLTLSTNAAAKPHTPPTTARTALAPIKSVARKEIANTAAKEIYTRKRPAKNVATTLVFSVRCSPRAARTTNQHRVTPRETLPCDPRRYI
jgi:hypothetical protein